MRILTIGDIHGDLEHLAWIILGVRDLQLGFDVVAITGDIGIDVLPACNRTPSHTEWALYDASIDAVISMLQELGADISTNLNRPVLFVPGNHDREVLASYASVINIDVRNPNWKTPFIHMPSGYAFYGLGGSSPTGFNGQRTFINEWTDTDPMVRESLEKISDGPKSVFISHVPPAGTIVDHSLVPPYMTCGSRMVRSFLEGRGCLTLVITGHVHERQCMTLDIVSGVPIFNAGGVYWPERIDILNNHNLPKTIMAMTVRFGLIEIRENTPKIIVTRYVQIAESQSPLISESFILDDRNPARVFRDGTRERLPTTDLLS